MMKTLLLLTLICSIYTAENNWTLVQSLDRQELIYTQGLVFKDHQLLESGGQYGSSSIEWLEIDKKNSKVSHSVKQKLDSKFFGEGCDVPPGNYVYQLTW